MMANYGTQSSKPIDKNLDVLGPSREQNPGGSVGAVGSKADP